MTRAQPASSGKATAATRARRYPIGAEPDAGGLGTHLRVWAPRCQRVVVRFGEGLASSAPLPAEAGGYFAGVVRGLRAGDRYGFQLDDDGQVYPDPASRFQPEGPHGPSEVVDGRAFAWSDHEWRGSGARGQVIYEMHVGTFTETGTYAAATERLADLRDLGVTLIELMPLAEFPGRFGWGYDGVDLWAPTRLYGRPDDLRGFVDAAHRLGMGVILDVVYNHVGPDGNYLARFSADYFTDRYANEWGAALNFDGDNAGPARELFVENAAYWIEEFHFDGLRLDATQQIHDASPEHLVAAVARRVREAAGDRATFLVAENESQDAKMVRAVNRGGYGLDALWNDDFHHSAVVALTGHNEAYFSDHLGHAQELISAIRWGFLFQGQRYSWQKQRRGTVALDLGAQSFVLYLENHDQVANAGGARLASVVAAADLRALTALTLLAPATPMLFQGQELGSTRPFFYFADQRAPLAADVAAGRRKFLAQFPTLAMPENQRRVPDPAADETFRACQLDWSASARERGAPVWQLHRDLLALRRDDPVFAQQEADRVHGVALGPRSLLLRIFGATDDRLLLVNYGADQPLVPAPEPLLAPPAGRRWRAIWSSEDARYGGRGTPPVETEDDGWRLPGHCAVVMAPGGSMSAIPSGDLSAPLSGPVRIGWRRGHPDAGLIAKEWLITNGLGGYASGTLAGMPTRRYHGALVASLPAPLGRTLMLNHLAETLHLADGTIEALSAIDPVPSQTSPGPELPPSLALFQLINGRPCWRFESGDTVLEKSLLMPHGQNTVLIRYRLIAARAPVRLVLEPLLDMRGHDSAVADGNATYRLARVSDGFEIAPPDAALPALRLRVEGGAADIAPGRGDIEVRYRLEQARGYDWRGVLRSAGSLQVALEPGGEIRLIASTEVWDQVKSLPALQVHALDEERRLRLIAQARPELRGELGAELILAADQFIITPHTRPRDEAILNAQGDTACTVIAGYPWFTDWGRDTMISLEGLTLMTGRFAEARDIIHTFAHHVRDGLIPNLFPEGQNEGLYHTADATLWFFHAVDRYEAVSGDRETRRFLLPRLAEIIEKHIAGTRFGIGVDPSDGLLRQGAPGYQLTWMDAKVGDWVVTPRRGKAVEINALFYNALCVMQRWLAEAENDGWAAEHGIVLRSADVGARAAALREAFNRRFWYADGGYLYDVVDGEGGDGGPRDDASVRPNQVFAISLPHPVLDPQHWNAVLDVVSRQLATPFGLRSLAPGHPDYKSRYDGDLRARDAAYHQGTVWGWLVGPFVDAWLKVHPDDTAGAARLLGGLEEQMSKSCIGTISEICDAEPPFAPRGCMAQAWSVAEALRVLSSIRTRPSG